MEWFYEQDGQQVGPVSRADIIRLIVQRRIQPHTLVWTPEFGDQWRPAIKAGLMISLPGRLRGAMDGRPGPEAWPDGRSIAAVPSLWAWIFLLVPHGLTIIEQVIAYIQGNAQPSYVAQFFIFIIFFMSLSLDRRVLGMAGIRPPSFWWFLFFPGYFVMRRERLGRGKGLVTCSIAMMILVMISTLIFRVPSDMDGKRDWLFSNPFQTEHHEAPSAHKDKPSSSQDEKDSPNGNDQMSI
ncbi:DUF4339 domain-containing protein [Saccharibacter sp. 17.LH.SD]|uniref:DUF4339 domain-containing protein n=1 Tax=Saccharibacter sp. 17.LH.SD TaxID=2689393 RepID=UPI001368A1BE|nr:DUF4339 domain-containing protein [Saccharibacter sp. 17.LH.SD]MXV44805.1 DUF4339 domain-containing protein [Saccharibacter sp. 17.LH.SD]